MNAGIHKSKHHIANLFKARFPIMYIQTWEENRVVDMIREIAENQDIIKTLRKVYVWSLSRGLLDLSAGNSIEQGTNDAIAAINHFIGLKENAILIVKDIHIYFGNLANNVIIRRLRDTADILAKGEYLKNIVITSPVLQIPVELEKDITIVDFELPNSEEIKSCLDSFINENWNETTINLSEEDKLLFAKTAQGLTLHEAENAFARALVERKHLTAQEIDIIVEEKCQVIKKTGILEFVNSDLSIDDVGGLDNLKNWLRKRNNSWSDKAQRLYNLPAPKGILMTGVPGCGKSLTAKAMASLWNLPLLRLDIGKIFNKWLGNSEENIRKVIQTAEAVSPSILWIDEIEKGFSGLNGNDDGTTKRIFGSFLTWLQEKTKPVFVVATANNISILPPEMLRKGRFDEIFFVDLPNTDERITILKLHLTRMLNGSISKEFNVSDTLLNLLAKKTEGFSGAEIEQVVISAVFEAFSEDRTLHEEDLLNAINNTIPLSVTQKEQIEDIRQWANTHAVLATGKCTQRERNKEG